MIRAVAVSLLAIFAAARVFAQATAVPPAFEVAEIKPSAEKDFGPGKERLLPGGRIEFPHATLKEFLMGAYGVQPDMIAGGPKWMDSDRFDVVAKAPNPNTPVPTLLLMLRNLLQERFRLVTHREDRVLPVYVLTIGKGGSKLRPTESAGGRQNCSTRPAEDGSGERPVLHRECRNMTVAELARQLGLPGYGVDRQVVDETGLSGAYDYEFDYARPMADGAAGPTIFEAMARLGLRLEAAKRPVPVIVIDSAQKPGEN